MADHTVPHQPRNRISATLALLTGTTLAAASISVITLTTTATPARAAGLSPFDIAGRGATVPFIEHEAENATHSGTRIGPDRRYGTLPSEASGREAVTLDAVGEYVEFTLTAPANAVTFRYSIPDNAAGTGRDATIDLRANGTLVKAVPVTSKYGWYYGGYPFNNNPGDINPHHFYDEARALFGTTYPTGTKIRLQVASTAQSPTFTIDLADFELVAAPITKPANVLDVVTDFGADPTGATDSTARFQAAVDAGRAQSRTVWIPPGSFTLWDHVVVDGVTLRGPAPGTRCSAAGTPPTASGPPASTAGTSPVAATGARSARTRPAAPAATCCCGISRSSATSGNGSTPTRSTPSAERCPTPWWTTSGCSTPRSVPGWTARWTTSPSATAGSSTRPPTG
nr:glycosyl hydrolase family 28-related protein [Verrucosispora sioxanthis]